MTVFGPIVTGKDVVNAVTTTIKEWSPDYLAEVAENSGRARGALPAFRSYPTMINLSKFDEDQTPACVIISPGTAQTPVQRSNQFQAQWNVGIGCIVSGQDDDNTYELVTLYTAAVRALLLHHQSLGGFAEAVRWVSERYDPLPDLGERTFGAGVVQFGVDVNNAINRFGGPTVPSVDPDIAPGDWPDVDSVLLTVKPMGS